jgi:signal transduction histidine kinase
MADRMAALGGTLNITSALGHGTRITGRVPARDGAIRDRGRIAGSLA